MRGDNNHIIIGGEHTYSPCFLLKRSKGYIDGLTNTFKNDYSVNFTFGGFYSLLAIIDDIRPTFDVNSFVLLPSYLCPSMLEPFKIRNINYRFYKVDADLYVDTEHLISCINSNVKAVLFIDYFGASQKERLKDLLSVLKEKDIKIIQDLVQCVNIDKNQLLGDYMYNSFRKFLPFEGSLLLSKTKMKISFTRPNYTYLLNKRLGQLLRDYHLKYNIFSSRQFLKLFKRAEDHYPSETIVRMPKINVCLLNRVDIDAFSANQKYYYKKLFVEYGAMVPKLLQNDDFVPLGFVIKTTNRDQIRRNLFVANIYPPIHWLQSSEIDKQAFSESIELSNCILTIPVFGLNETKSDYLFSNLYKNIKP